MNLACGAAILALAVLWTGCTQFTVRTREDPDAHLAARRIFAWLPPELAAPADQRTQDRAVSKRLREQVERLLVAKGYRPAAADQPVDFFMNWRITATPTVSWQVEQGHLGWGTGWWSGWPGGAELYADSYDSGTLFLAAMDPGQRTIVWLGVAEARLLPHVSLDRRLQRVDAAVEHIMREFPVR